MNHDPYRDPVDRTTDTPRHLSQAPYDARRTGALALVLGVLFVIAIALMFSGSPPNNPDSGSNFRAEVPKSAPATQNQ